MAKRVAYIRKPKFGRKIDHKNLLWMMRTREITPAEMAATMGLSETQFLDRIRGGCGFDMRHMVLFCEAFEIDYSFIPRYFLQYEKENNEDA